MTTTLTSMQRELSDMKKLHLQDQGRISSLERENWWLKQVLKSEMTFARRPRVQAIEKNVMLFPLREIGTKEVPATFKDAVSDDKVHDTLGIPKEECEVVDRGPDSAWVRVHVKTMARKRQVNRYPVRSALRQNHKVVLKEELLPEEEAERAHLKPTMDVLYKHGFHPYWLRGAIAWWKDDKFAIINVLDIIQGMTEAEILAKAHTLSQHGQVARAKSHMDTRAETTTIHGSVPRALNATVNPPTAEGVTAIPGTSAHA